MSQPIYYYTTGFLPDGSDPKNGNSTQQPHSAVLPLPSTGNFAWAGKQSSAPNCEIALKNLSVIQKRDKNKGFPQTLRAPGRYVDCESSSSGIKLNIPILDTKLQKEEEDYLSSKAATQPQAAGRTRRHRVARRRRATRRKVRKTRRSRRNKR